MALCKPSYQVSEDRNWVPRTISEIGSHDEQSLKYTCKYLQIGKKITYMRRSDIHEYENQNISQQNRTLEIEISICWKHMVSESHTFLWSKYSHHRTDFPTCKHA